MQLPKIDRFLASDAGLQPLVSKAREIGALAKLCEEFLPPELAHATRAANCKDGRLVLLAATSAAAAKLKMLSESLTDFLLKRGAKVNSVSVRVQPERAPSAAAAPQHRRPLSAQNIAALSKLYEAMSDSPAKRALRRLLARATQASSTALPASPRRRGRLPPAQR